MPRAHKSNTTSQTTHTPTPDVTSTSAPEQDVPEGTIENVDEEDLAQEGTAREETGYDAAPEHEGSAAPMDVNELSPTTRADLLPLYPELFQVPEQTGTFEVQEAEHAEELPEPYSSDNPDEMEYLDPAVEAELRRTPECERWARKVTEPEPNAQETEQVAEPESTPTEAEQATTDMLEPTTAAQASTLEPTEEAIADDNAKNPSVRPSEYEGEPPRKQTRKKSAAKGKGKGKTSKRRRRDGKTVDSDSSYTDASEGELERRKLNAKAQHQALKEAKRIAASKRTGLVPESGPVLIVEPTDEKFAEIVATDIANVVTECAERQLAEHKALSARDCAEGLFTHILEDFQSQIHEWISERVDAFFQRKAIEKNVDDILTTVTDKLFDEIVTRVLLEEDDEEAAQARHVAAQAKLAEDAQTAPLTEESAPSNDAEFQRAEAPSARREIFLAPQQP